MSIFLTFVKGVVLILLLFSSAFFILFHVNPARKLTYLGEEVLINRDAYGIPSINATSFRSMCHGWGYAIAQDRLFQISFKREIAMGKLSELVGQNGINTDKMFKEINLNYWAVKTAEKTEYKNYQAFADGVNAYVNSLVAMPIQFQLIGLKWREYTVSDIYLVKAFFRWATSYNAAEEYIRSTLLSKFSRSQVQKMVPFTDEQWWNSGQTSRIVQEEDMPEDLRNLSLFDQLEPPFEPVAVNLPLSSSTSQTIIDTEKGSNNWIISGNKTTSGWALNVNDPHLDNSLPGEWYQIKIAYLHNGKKCSLAGRTMPGSMVLLGKTRYVSTSYTIAPADVQDLYKEIIKDEKYLLDGSWVPLKKRIQTIKVKGSSKLIEYPVYQTHRGPIMHFLMHVGTLYQIANDSLSLAWSGFYAEYQDHLYMSHVSQIQNFEQLMNVNRKHSRYLPNVNLLYTTIDGHIGYQHQGNMPKRKNHLSGTFVKDGSTTLHDWPGFLTSEQHLYAFDPKKGYLLNSNNKNAGKYFLNGTTDTCFYTARANRIDKVLKEQTTNGRKVSMNDTFALLLDTVDENCLAILPSILKLLPQAQPFLSGFNCDFTYDSRHAAPYQVFLYEFFVLTNPWPGMGFNLLNLHSYVQYQYRFLQQIAEGITTDPKSKDLVKSAWKKAVSFLRQRLGSDHLKWKWSQLHRDIMIHRPFSNSPLKSLYERSFAGRGNLHTVNIGKMNKISSGNFATLHRANLRVIMSYGEKSLTICDGGASQNVFSRHYEDQLDIFLKDGYIPLEDEIDQQ